MDFIRGLCAAGFFLAVMWGIHQWGYARGADAEMSLRITAQDQAKDMERSALYAKNKNSQCNKILAGIE